MRPRERKVADPRHIAFRALLEAYWREEENVHVPDLPWGAAEAGALGAFLRANPTLEQSAFQSLLKNRLASEDHARGESPRVWLSSLTRYANGPLDRFKLLKRPAMHSDATVGMRREDSEPSLSNDAVALNYWRIVHGTNRLKYEREVPMSIRVQLAAENL